VERLPATAGHTDDVRESVDEQFARLLDNHADIFEALLSDVEGSTGMYDDVTDDVLAAVDDQFDLLVEAHEELEGQSVEATEAFAGSIEEMQAQVEWFAEGMQDAPQQTFERVEA